MNAARDSSMLGRAAVIARLALLSGCSTSRVVDLGPDLQVLRLSDHVWVHVSEDKTDRWGTVPANGMILVGDADSILVDTGWNESQGARLLAFAADTLKHPARGAVLTHAHVDRIGGLAAVKDPGFVVYAHASTAPAIAKLHPRMTVETFETEKVMTIGKQKVELYHPGAGHTRDNITVWLEDEKVLFGGCLVKSGRSPDLGNREEAVLAEWPLSVLRLGDRYTTAELVIPGHGQPGGPEILQHTLGLLEQEMSPTTHNGHNKN